ALSSIGSGTFTPISPPGAIWLNSRPGPVPWPFERDNRRDLFRHKSLLPVIRKWLSPDPAHAWGRFALPTSIAFPRFCPMRFLPPIAIEARYLPTRWD